MFWNKKESTKCCDQCKNFIPDTDSKYEYAKCKQNIRNKQILLVSSKAELIYGYCDLTRMDCSKCGPQGKWYDQKPSQ
jgi:hypothetical protein